MATVCVFRGFAQWLDWYKHTERVEDKHVPRYAYSIWLSLKLDTVAPKWSQSHRSTWVKNTQKNSLVQIQEKWTEQQIYRYTFVNKYIVIHINHKDRNGATDIEAQPWTNIYWGPAIVRQKVKSWEKKGALAQNPHTGLREFRVCASSSTIDHSTSPSPLPATISILRLWASFFYSKAC